MYICESAMIVAAKGDWYSTGSNTQVLGQWNHYLKYSKEDTFSWRIALLFSRDQVIYNATDQAIRNKITNSSCVRQISCGFNKTMTVRRINIRAIFKE